MTFQLSDGCGFGFGRFGGGFAHGCGVPAFL